MGILFFPSSKNAKIPTFQLGQFQHIGVILQFFRAKLEFEESETSFSLKVDILKSKNNNEKLALGYP
jgi:hypothetical protein